MQPWVWWLQVNQLPGQLQHIFGHRSIDLSSPLYLCIFLEHCQYTALISDSSIGGEDEEGAPT
jgi:hypothetical protein